MKWKFLIDSRTGRWRLYNNIWVNGRKIFTYGYKKGEKEKEEYGMFIRMLVGVEAVVKWNGVEREPPTRLFV